MLAIKKVFMTSYFQSVIEGFSDTLPILVKCNSEKGKGKNKLENLARTLGINSDLAHNAIADVRMLEQVLFKFNVSDQTIKDNCIKWTLVEQQETTQTMMLNKLKNLKALNQCTSVGIRKKMVTAGISYDMLIKAYKESKLHGISSLLGKNEEGQVKVSTNKKVLQKLNDFLETL